MKRKERERKRIQSLATKQIQEPVATKILNPNIAQQELITFSFIKLDLERGKFICTAGDGEQLFNIIDNLKKHSNYDFNTVGKRKNCHFIPEKQVNAHGLEDILKNSGVSKLFQLGSKRQPERIIGYFESNRSNIFNVCLLDLRHQLSGD